MKYCYYCMNECADDICPHCGRVRDNLESEKKVNNCGKLLRSLRKILICYGSVGFVCIFFAMVLLSVLSWYAFIPHCFLAVLTIIAWVVFSKISEIDLTKKEFKMAMICTLFNRSASGKLKPLDYKSLEDFDEETLENVWKYHAYRGGKAFISLAVFSAVSCIVPAVTNIFMIILLARYSKQLDNANDDKSTVKRENKNILISVIYSIVIGLTTGFIVFYYSFKFLF